MSEVLTAAAQLSSGKRFHIPSLDGVRSVSFLIVFLAHAGLEKWVPGYFGLTVFFFLSGYLITTLLRIEFDRSARVNLKEFYLRRVLRIFPPFYLILIVASLLTGFHLLDGSLAVGPILGQMFHLSNYLVLWQGWWSGRAPGTWVYWSLAVEEHFYLVFPLLFIILQRYVPCRRRQALILGGLCLLILAWRCLLVFGYHVPKDRTYVATDTRVDSILFGCILALWHNPVLDEEQVSTKKLCGIWLPSGLLLLLASIVIRVPQFEQTFRYTLQGIALFPLFIAAIRFHDSGVVRLLNLRWVKYVGVLTYSLYLMHTTVLYALGQWTSMPVPVRGSVALAVCLVLAALIHRYIEKPIGQLRRRLSSTVAVPHDATRPLSPPLGTGVHTGAEWATVLVGQAHPSDHQVAP